jgi:heme-degrading monooxygenase HmoA
MSRCYSHTTWQVKAGSEEEFVCRWDEFALWSALEGMNAQATLLRDTDDPSRFVSFGPWETVESVIRWRTLPGYAEHVGRIGELLESFDAHTLELIEKR